MNFFFLYFPLFFFVPIPQYYKTGYSAGVLGFATVKNFHKEARFSS